MLAYHYIIIIFEIRTTSIIQYLLFLKMLRYKQLPL